MKNGTGHLSNIQLEGLKAAPYRSTAGTLSPGALLAHQDVDAGLAQAAYALSAGVRLLEQGHTLAGGAVDLRVLRRVARRRVGKASGLDVEVLAALATLDRWERLRGLRVVGRRCQRLLQRGCLVALEGMLREWGQRCPVDGDGGLRDLTGKINI